MLCLNISACNSERFLSLALLFSCKHIQLSIGWFKLEGFRITNMAKINMIVFSCHTWPFQLPVCSSQIPSHPAFIPHFPIPCKWWSQCAYFSSLHHYFLLGLCNILMGLSVFTCVQSPSTLYMWAEQALKTQIELMYTCLPAIWLCLLPQLLRLTNFHFSKCSTKSRLLLSECTFYIHRSLPVVPDLVILCLYWALSTTLGRLSPP